VSNFSVGKGSSVDDDFFLPDSLNSHSPVLGPKRKSFFRILACVYASINKACPHGSHILAHDR
jgi:hypothetical protein